MGKKILAKSSKYGEETLIQHTQNALQVFKSLKNAYPEVIEICDEEKFYDYLFAAIFLHDFGKAAEGFQRMLKEGKPWGYRHEIISAGFISCLPFSNDVRKDISLAIITHHKDLYELQENYSTLTAPGKDNYIRRLKELNDNIKYLQYMIGEVPRWSKEYLGYEISLKQIQSIEEIQDAFCFAAKEYLNDYEDKKVEKHKRKLFLRGFLTACDHLSSASQDEIIKAISDMEVLFKFDKYKDTQLKAMNTKGSAVLIAPTGYGKTEASLLWSNYNQNESKGKRVFYILPYTASINAMYNRLKNSFGDESVALLHGKAFYFLYKEFTKSGEDYFGAVSKAKTKYDLSKKIFKPYKILTPFQILKYFFSVTGFEQHIGEMAGGLFIVDEVHSYDPHTTALILESLKYLKEEYNAEIFIMSATLPEFLKKLFMEELNIGNLIEPNKEEIKAIARHRVSIIEGDAFSNISRIIKDIKEDKKVLVACNTVERAQNIYCELKKYAKKSALLHSRFVLKDRERIEKNLNSVQLLVGTQAIEVSLDIDFDILYTDPAPIDALIQRFGRVNRKGLKNVSPVYIFSKGSEEDRFVYKNQSIVNKTLELLSKCDVLSEDLIQNLVNETYKNGYDDKDYEEFLKARESFKSVIGQLYPFIENKQVKEEFYEMFDNREVVPYTFKEEYMDKIKNKEYFEAVGYMVGISQRRYISLKKQGLIEDDGYDVDFVYCEYDKDLGLLIGNAYDNIFTP
ncbi:CRISPR-associated helicase/endonuclease Cas3 [Thermoanaerobacterium sp. PSU-2]|uniref:CRISPR-associated helicase/endonuclease Cas3 n=1 Tax=Thermoanaerobacterium sp. PSU-2 TaxID=1930849 RepID=UPI000A14F94A|nr:CRISPR-associated helicase/endonuclease Cas3 [Thermoanaerobacterium sp. PSU-2]ORX22453.1 CRISPR-associated helicase/endonuclease Cas3 [Thermoanaerobacterium sp. PSU-2]